MSSCDYISLYKTPAYQIKERQFSMCTEGTKRDVTNPLGDVVRTAVSLRLNVNSQSEALATQLQGKQSC